MKQINLKLEALNNFKNLNRTMPQLKEILYSSFARHYDEYFNKGRTEEGWISYVLARDLFLQFSGIINLEAELRNLDIVTQSYGYKSQINKDLKDASRLKKGMFQ